MSRLPTRSLTLCFSPSLFRLWLSDCRLSPTKSVAGRPKNSLARLRTVSEPFAEVRASLQLDIQQGVGSLPSPVKHSICIRALVGEKRADGAQRRGTREMDAEWSGVELFDTTRNTSRGTVVAGTHIMASPQTAPTVVGRKRSNSVKEALAQLEPTRPTAAKANRPAWTRPTGPLAWLVRPADALKVIVAVLAAWFATDRLVGADRNPITPFLFISYPLPTAPGETSQRYGKGPLDLAFLGFYIIVFSFLRQSVTEYLVRPLARNLGLRTESKVQRFMEQAYAVVYFSASGAYGLVRRVSVSFRRHPRSHRHAAVRHVEARFVVVSDGALLAGIPALVRTVHFCAHTMPLNLTQIPSTQAHGRSAQELLPSAIVRTRVSRRRQRGKLMKTTLQLLLAAADDHSRHGVRCPVGPDLYRFILTDLSFPIAWRNRARISPSS